MCQNDFHTVSITKKKFPEDSLCLPLVNKIVSSAPQTQTIGWASNAVYEWLGCSVKQMTFPFSELKQVRKLCQKIEFGIPLLLATSASLFKVSIKFYKLRYPSLSTSTKLLINTAKAWALRCALELFCFQTDSNNYGSTKVFLFCTSCKPRDYNKPNHRSVMWSDGLSTATCSSRKTCSQRCVKKRQQRNVRWSVTKGEAD